MDIFLLAGIVTVAVAVLVAAFSIPARRRRTTAGAVPGARHGRPVRPVNVDGLMDDNAISRSDD